MLPVAYEIKPVAELMPGNLALVGTSSGNHIVLTLDPFQEREKVRDMLSLRSIIAPESAPTLLRVPIQDRVGFDLGSNFSLDFNMMTDDTYLRATYPDPTPGTIFVTGKNILMMVHHHNPQLSDDEVYIDLMTGEFAGSPGSGTCAEITAWKLLLHAEKPEANPMVLRQWSRRENKAV